MLEIKSIHYDLEKSRSYIEEKFSKISEDSNIISAVLTIKTEVDKDKNENHKHLLNVSYTAHLKGGIDIRLESQDYSIEIIIDSLKDKVSEKLRRIRDKHKHND